MGVHTGVKGPEKYIKIIILQIPFSRVGSHFCQDSVSSSLTSLSSTHFHSGSNIPGECSGMCDTNRWPSGAPSTANQHPFSHACGLLLQLFCPRLNLTKPHRTGNAFNISIPMGRASPAAPNVGLLKPTKIYD